MRAAVFREHGRPLATETVADPVPASGQGILEVANAGICGSDLHMTENPAMTPGIILGHEFVGTIVALGKEVAIRYSQAYTEHDFKMVIDAIAKGELKPGPIHSSTVSLDDLSAAFEALRNQPRECKVLIRPS